MESDNAQQFWDANPIDLSTTWTANDVVAEVINIRMSGGQSPLHWLTWLIQDYFGGRKFRNLLSPGCGTGDHEVIMAKSGVVDQIDAFDFSENSLQIAKQKSSEAGVRINFYRDDLNAFVISPEKKYDLVMCSGSLHHVKELERFLGIVRSVLTVDGFFIVNEYVGACYNIYDERKTQILNRIYQCIPPSLRSGQSDCFRNATIDDALAADPSESVRSSLILPFLREYFDIKVYHPFGGQLLHPIYNLLDHRQFSQRDPRIEAIIRLILEFEMILSETPGGLQSDFCLCVCKLKRT